MNEIVKICLKHGELTAEKTHKEKNKTKRGFIYRCNQCKLEKDRRWKDINREQHIEASKRWKKNNRDKVNEWQKQDRAKDPVKYREWTNGLRDTKEKKMKRTTKDILNFFNLTQEQYDQMFIDHKNLCGICEKPETRKSRTEGNICRLAVDHCHSTNKIRGLLCHHCNAALGHFKDNIDILKSAIRYLEKHTHI